MIKASSRILVLVFLFTLIMTSITYHHQQILAKSKQKSEDESAIFIIETSEPPSQVINKIKNQHDKLEFRKIFTTLYQGFSIKMPRKLKTEIKGIEGINRIDEIAFYEPALQESVPFINGGFNHPTFLDDNGQALTGKGVKVAVIDTGVDYTHPDLKDSYRGGFDVIDEDDDPMETMQEEGVATLHGTHVAGIIAANGRLRGVAPDVELYAYRTLGPTGMGTTEQVIAAIEKAIEDEVDIINLSLGNTVNGPDWPTSIALDKAVENGVVAVTSNGNSGPNLWTVGSPGTSGKAISVGASTPPMMVPYLMTAPNDKEKIPLTPMQKAKEWKITREYQLEFVGLGKKEAYAQKDVRGKIVLAERGQISFTQKGLFAKEAGAVALIVYNHTDQDFAGMLEEEIDMPIVSIPRKAGEDLKKQVTKKEVYLRTVYYEEEDFIAPFSSRGPVTHTWGIKPDLVAPGVAIDSTIPRGYLPLNGTSMSSPHVAGAAALIKQKYPSWTPDQIKAALMNTAKAIKDQEGKEYPPHVQGTGRLQLNEALKAETLVYPSSLTFGKWGKDDLRSQKTMPITIENHSTERKRYTFEPPFEVPDGIQWKVPFSLYLSPGEVREVQMTIDILPTVFEEGLYYDNIYVRSGSQSIAIPYLFFIEEPAYPRLMAFMFEQMVEEATYHYEVYLPGGADTLSISIYDLDTFQFIKKIDVCSNLERGMFEQELKIEDIEPGIYRALVVAKKDGQEDTIEQDIYIGEWEKEE